MMRSRSLKAVLLAMPLVFCTLAPAIAQEELKIGGIGPLSGGGTAWGLAVQRGVEMAIDEVNKAGGLKVGEKTYQPKLIMYDDQYTAAGGGTAAERLALCAFGGADLEPGEGYRAVERLRAGDPQER